MMKQNFNPNHFAVAGFEKSAGEYSDEDRALFSLIKKVCPELSEWGDLPIGVAWGAYSQDVYLLSWLEEQQKNLIRSELIEFLSYIKWHDVNGEPQWGITPEELAEFASQHSII